MPGLPTCLRPRPGDALLVATTNPGKIREIRDVLLDGTDCRFALLTLSDLSSNIPAPDETGRTFAENAALKALAYAPGLRPADRRRGLRTGD